MLHYRLQRHCRYCHIRVELMSGTRLARLAVSVTITVSAFLLFQVQPIVAKALLPWFGGAPAVWTVCMLFFQGLLLAGYVYAVSRSRAPTSGCTATVWQARHGLVYDREHSVILTSHR